ncbi:peptidylprolyl isomerase [Microcoleus sp. Pol17_C1]|uniref:peptidylprolyl isomerase n=1 Tax=unclassified Microcoleus TaxID=2642155 RepID=UPI002FD013C1
MVVNDEKFAQELKNRILQGSSFEQLGREYAANSEKVINFRTRTISREEMPEQMRNAVDKARVGELIEPFLSHNNWLLWRIEQLLTVTLDGEIKRQLQNELFEEWLTEKMTKSKIQRELREGF